MSSVVVVGAGIAGTGIGVAGAVVISGVIVGGVIIGIALSRLADKKKEEAEKEKELETFENNKSYLRNQFESAKINLLEEIELIQEEYKDELLNEINKMDAVSEKLLEKYTINEFRSVAHERFINLSILQFNEEVYKIRQKIELTRLEIAETKESINDKIKQITKQFSDTSKDIPDSFKSDFEYLKKQFKEVKSVSSIKSQSEILNKFQKQVNKLVQEYKLSKNIDISAIEEQKLSVSEIDTITAKVKEEIQNFYSKIKNLDKDISSELDPLIDESNESNYEQRLKIIKDQVKLKYGKLKEQIAETNVYKYNLAKLVGVISNFTGSEEILKQIGVLLKDKYINKSDYDELSRRISEFVAHAQNAEFIKSQKKELIGKVKNSLESLGYGVIDDTQKKQDILPKLENGEIVYLDTDWKEYKVMLKIDDNSQIATRMVKFVSTDEEKNNVSTYQRQKDAEITKKWCKDYDKFLDNMREQGIELDIKLRKEVEEENVMYIVNKDMKQESKQKAEKKNMDGEMRV